MLHAQSLSFQFEDGDFLFKDINFSIGDGLSALVGRNGIGKSVLARILSGIQKPSSGSVAFSVAFSGAVAHYQQSTSLQTEFGNQTLADVLSVSDKLAALERVQRGSCQQRDYDLIGDDWLLADRLTLELQALGIAATLTDKTGSLSGGQLSRLTLWSLFQRKRDLLILDEPSNHLDAAGKDWLIDKINRYQGAILVISHDRHLLASADRILSMTALGIEYFRGSFEAFEKEQALTLDALARRQKNIERQQAVLDRQQQESREKAERRRRQGKQLRRSGSQAKVLLDAKKESAESAMSGRNSQQRTQQENLKQRHREIKSKQQQLNPVSMHIEHSERRHGRLLVMHELVLPYVLTTENDAPSISRTVDFGQKVHLKGANGAGKSTLFKVLLGQLPPQSGEFHCSVPLHYVDQHFSQLQGTDSLLESVMRLCPHWNQTRSRSLLAASGFRADRSSLIIDELSGGEKMRLAMLVVGQQPGEALLLLDEPDNHLDLQSKRRLAKALSEYRGSFILVSHDEYFVRDAGVRDTWSLE